MTQLEQQRAALRHANSVRKANADLRADLRRTDRADALQRIADLLCHPEPPMTSMPIGRLLSGARGIGPTKAFTITRAAQIWSLDRRVDQLTDRQRHVLASRLRVIADGIR